MPWVLKRYRCESEAKMVLVLLYVAIPVRPELYIMNSSSSPDTAGHALTLHNVPFTNMLGLL